VTDGSIYVDDGRLQPALPQLTPLTK